MNKYHRWMAGSVALLLVVCGARAEEGYGITGPTGKTSSTDGKTIVVQNGSGGFGGSFQPARSLRMHLQPNPATLVKAAFLGVTASEVSGALRSQLKLQPGVGLVVESVEPDSPAAKAGVAQYDILEQFNDQVLIDTRQLAVLVRLAKTGDEVTLKGFRHGEPLSLKATLEEKEVEPLDALPGADLRVPWERFSYDKYNLEAEKAMEMLRKTKSNGQLSYSDKGMMLQITQENGKSHLVARDSKGKVVYEGPLNTEEERKGLPPEVLKRLKSMEATTRPAAAGD